MRIEKKYHTQAAEEWDELVREEEKRRAGLSEEERLNEQEHLHREAGRTQSFEKQRKWTGTAFISLIMKGSNVFRSFLQKLSGWRKS